MLPLTSDSVHISRLANTRAACSCAPLLFSSLLVRVMAITSGEVTHPSIHIKRRRRRMAIFTLGQITQNRPGARESVTNGPSRSEPTRAIGPIVGEIVVNVQCWCHLLESKCWGKGKTDVAGRYRKTLPGSAEGFDYMETLYSNSYRRSPWINLSTLVWITFHGRNIGAQHNLLTGGPWCFHFAIQFLKKKRWPLFILLYMSCRIYCTPRLVFNMTGSF